MKKIMADAKANPKTVGSRLVVQSDVWVKLFFVLVVIVATFQLLRDLQTLSENQQVSNSGLAQVLQASNRGTDGNIGTTAISPYLNDSYNRCQNKAGLSMEFSIDGSNSVSRDDMKDYMQQMYNTGGRFINIDVNFTEAGQLESAIDQGIKYVKEAHNQHLVPAFSLEGGRDSAFFDDASFVADFYKGIAEGVGENKYFVATTLQDYYFEESPSVVNSSSTVGALAVEAAEALQNYSQIIIGTPQFPIWQDCTEDTGGTSCVQLIEEEDFRVHSKLDAYIKDGAMTDRDFSKFDMLLLQIKNRDDDFKIESSKYAKRGYGMYSLIARYINNIQRDEFKRSMRTMIFDYGIATDTTPGNPDNYSAANPKIQRERLAYDFFEFSSDPYVDAVFFDSESMPYDNKFQTTEKIQDKGNNCYYDLESYNNDVYTQQGKASPVKTETVTEEDDPARVNIVCDPETKQCGTGFQFTTQVGLPIRSFGSNSAAGTDTKPYMPLSTQLSSQVTNSADFLNQFAAKLEAPGVDYAMPWLGNALNSAYPGINYLNEIPNNQFDLVGTLNAGVYADVLGEEGAYEEYLAYMPGGEGKEKASGEEVVYSGVDLGVGKEFIQTLDGFRNYSPDKLSNQTKVLTMGRTEASTPGPSCKTGVNFALSYSGVDETMLGQASQYGYGYGLYIMYGNESSSDIAKKLDSTCNQGIKPVLRSCDAVNDCNFNGGADQGRKIVKIAEQTSCNDFYAICGHNEPIADFADGNVSMLDKEGEWTANCVKAIKNSGVANKVKITTPTFNATHPEFKNIASNFKSGYSRVSNFDSDKSEFECLSFNTYDDVGGQPATHYYDIATGIFPGMPVCIMETGANATTASPPQQEHVKAMQSILEHGGADLQFALGFNFMGTNPGFKGYKLDQTSNKAVASCQTTPAQENKLFINNDPQNMIYGSEQITKEVSLQEKLGTTHANEIVYKWIKGGVDGNLSPDDYTVKLSEQCRCQNDVEGLITPYATERRLRTTDCKLTPQQLKNPNGPQCVEYLGGANNYAESTIYVEESFPGTKQYDIPGAYDALAALYNEVQTRLSGRNEKLIFNQNLGWQAEIMQRAYRKIGKPEYQISSPRKNNFINHAMVLGESTDEAIAQTREPEAGTSATEDAICKTGINFALPYRSITPSTLDKAANFGYGYGLYMMYGDEPTEEIATKLDETCARGVQPILRSCDAVNDCKFNNGTEQGRKIVEVAKQTSCRDFYAICGHNEPIADFADGDVSMLDKEGEWTANCVEVISSSDIADRVKITTPTFNATHPKFEQIVSNFKSGYSGVSNFDRDKQDFDCLSFNTYDDVGGRSAVDYYDRAVKAFPNMPVCIMETGRNASETSVDDNGHMQALQSLLDHGGGNLKYVLGFNFMNTNAGFEEYAISDSSNASIASCTVTPDPTIQVGENVKEAPPEDQFVVESLKPGEYNFRYNYYPADKKAFHKEKHYYKWIGAIDELVRIYDLYAFESSLPTEISRSWVGWPDCDSDFVAEQEARGRSVNCIANYSPANNDNMPSDPLGEFLCEKGYSIVGECEEKTSDLDRLQCTVPTANTIEIGGNDDIDGTYVNLDVDKYTFHATPSSYNKNVITDFTSTYNLDYAINTNFSAYENRPEGLVGGFTPNGEKEVDFFPTERGIEYAFVVHDGSISGADPSLNIVAATNKFAIIDVRKESNFNEEKQSRITEIIDMAMTGVPLLVQGGEPMDTSVNYRGITGDYSPRTIIGWRQGGEQLVMAVLDGADLVEMVDVADDELNLDYALALDGGGSSQLYSSKNLPTAIPSEQRLLNNKVYWPGRPNEEGPRERYAYFGAKLICNDQCQAGGTYITKPFNGDYRVTQAYGDASTVSGVTRTHTGIDYGVPEGTSVLAAQTGEVIVAVKDKAGCSRSDYSSDRSYLNDCARGNYVTIKHESDSGQTYYTQYSHLSEVNVNVGDKAQIGDVIGLSGNTGRSTGPHLDFELRLNENTPDNSVNPNSYMCTSDATNDFATSLSSDKTYNDLEELIITVTNSVSNNYKEIPPSVLKAIMHLETSNFENEQTGSRYSGDPLERGNIEENEAEAAGPMQFTRNTWLGIINNAAVGQCLDDIGVNYSTLRLNHRTYLGPALCGAAVKLASDADRYVQSDFDDWLAETYDPVTDLLYPLYGQDSEQIEQQYQEQGGNLTKDIAPVQAAAKAYYGACLYEYRDQIGNYCNSAYQLSEEYEDQF